MDFIFKVACLALFVSVTFTGIFAGESPDPEVYMNTIELIENQGYPAETHEATTSDGYILELHRIPHGKGQCLDGPCVNKGVVLIQHALLSSSAAWVENLVNESLGFILADQGYDVWLGNNRGNTYARRHVSLSANDDDFWEFSWDEMALYDVPALVDKVIEVTGVSQITYVGHSQGTQIAFAALSSIDELNDKISLFAAFAPIAFLGQTTGLFHTLGTFTTHALSLVLGDGEFLAKSAILTAIADLMCFEGLPGAVCENVLFLICGTDVENTNQTRIPVYVGQHPAGTSTRNMLHYVQSSVSDKFQMYDFGSHANRARYSQSAPPQYDLSNIRTNVALYAGGHDTLSTSESVDILWPKLTNTAHKSLNVYPAYNHLDFMWSISAGDNLYVDLMKRIQSVV